MKIEIANCSFTSSMVSLTVNIRQSIKAEDLRLLTTLVTKADVKTVCSTAKELSGEEAVKLLEFLADFLASDHRRLSIVMDWARELILSHATFISSQTRTRLALKPILDIINQRVADNSELVHMRQVANTVVRNAQKNSVEVATPTRTPESDEPAMRWRADE